MSRPERLAYWYFRLNGFLTTENFVLHPDSGADQRTDADLFAVRFRHRRELLESPMEDDPRVAECGTLVNVIIAEIKKGTCNLNGPWTRPEDENMRRAVRALGCVLPELEQECCATLYKRGEWAENGVTVRLFAVGAERNPQLVIPLVQQITWAEIVTFCIERFQKYPMIKRAVHQWTADGERLGRMAREGSQTDIRHYFGLDRANSQ